MRNDRIAREVDRQLVLGDSPFRIQGRPCICAPVEMVKLYDEQGNTVPTYEWASFFVDCPIHGMQEQIR
jgi:hypothetical protein